MVLNTTPSILSIPVISRVGSAYYAYKFHVRYFAYFLHIWHIYAIEVNSWGKCIYLYISCIFLHNFFLHISAYSCLCIFWHIMHIETHHVMHILEMHICAYSVLHISTYFLHIYAYGYLLINAYWGLRIVVCTSI